MVVCLYKWMGTYCEREEGIALTTLCFNSSTPGTWSLEFQGPFLLGPEAMRGTWAHLGDQAILGEERPRRLEAHPLKEQS